MNLNIKTVKNTYKLDKLTGNYLKVIARVTEKVEKPYELISSVTISNRFIGDEVKEVITNECKYIRTIKNKSEVPKINAPVVKAPEVKGKKEIPKAK